MTTIAPEHLAAVAEVKASGRRRRVVLGVGNILLSDDGVGVVIAEHVRDELSRRGVTVVDGGTLSHTLLPLIEDADALVAVDAGRLGAEPGTVTVFEGAAMDEYLSGRGAGSVHEVGLRDLLDMARLRDALPALRALVVIQPDRVEWGSALTRAVSDAVPVAAAEVRRLLERWQ